MTAPHQSDAEGVHLTVRVTPRAKRSAMAGLWRDAAGRLALRVRVAAPPAGGAANAALAMFLAEQLGLGRNTVAKLSGTSARLKILGLSGDGPAIVARLSPWLA